MINLELYKIFAIVAKEKNITRASEIMNISQPAVTKHIKNLENQLNVTLFERKNGMKLTIKGKELFENIYPEIEKLIKAEEELTGNRKINFGTYNTMVTTMFSESISKYYKENKNRKINVINLNIPSMFSMLENLELDLIVCKKVDEKVYDKTKIKYIKLGEMENVLIASKSSQLARKCVGIEDLLQEIIYIPRNESISTTKFINKLVGANIKKIDSSTMIKIVEKGEGIGLITKKYIQNSKVSILKTDFEIEDSEYGIYVNKNNRFKELKEFIEILKQQI